MDETYRLVFRGEVLDGRHPAVVKKRLIEALKLSADQAEKLFSSSAVVLKAQADTQTAARFQAMFKQAGARLRVTRVPGNASPARSADEPKSATSTASTTEMQVLPVGSDVLRSDERARAAVTMVDVSHLGILPDEPRSIVAASAPVVVKVPDFSVADLGVDLVDHIERPIIDIDPHFDLAEVGADIGLPHDDPAPAVPDISHLSVVAQ